jgi:hypothetical protein
MAAHKCVHCPVYLIEADEVAWSSRLVSSPSGVSNPSSYRQLLLILRHSDSSGVVRLRSIQDGLLRPLLYHELVRSSICPRCLC